MICWGGVRPLLGDSILFLALWLGVSVAWSEVGAPAAVAATGLAVALTLRWLCVIAVFGSERVRVVNRLWACAVPVTDISAVGLIGVYTFTRWSPAAVLLYLRNGSAVPVVATARPFYGAHRRLLPLADLYDVPIVLRASRAAIDHEVAFRSAGHGSGRSNDTYRAYLARAKTPEEAGVEMPVNLRRGWLKPTSLGQDPDSRYREPELSEVD